MDCLTDDGLVCSGRGFCLESGSAAAHCACVPLYLHTLNCTQTYFAEWGLAGAVFGVIFGLLLLLVVVEVLPDFKQYGWRVIRVPIAQAKFLLILFCICFIIEQAWFILNVELGREVIYEVNLRNVSQGLYFILFGAFCAAVFLSWIEIMEKVRTLGEITYLIRMRWAVLIGLLIAFSFVMVALGVGVNLSPTDPAKALLNTLQTIVAGLYFLMVLIMAIVALILGRKFWKSVDISNESISTARFKTTLYIASVIVFSLVIVMALVGNVVQDGDAWGYYYRNIVWNVYYLVFFCVTLAFLQRNLVPYQRRPLQGYWSDKTGTSGGSAERISKAPKGSMSTASTLDMPSISDKSAHIGNTHNTNNLESRYDSRPPEKETSHDDPSEHSATGANSDSGSDMEIDQEV